MTERRPQGPLPGLLVGLTVVSGLVDAFSLLGLGRVFVANMTGNVVFLGFAIAGTGGVSIEASLLALAAFALGARLGGRWAADRTPHRGRLLAVATGVQAGLVVIAAIVVSVVGVPNLATQLGLLGLLGLAMGGQNGVVRRLGVPGLPTTVLTRSITGLVVDAGHAPLSPRPLLSVLALLCGAIVGAALLRWLALPAPLWLAALLLVGYGMAAKMAATRPRADDWH
ncbi:DUF1275 domain-containing protein [Micromonospora sp. NBC_01699]|uniref:YoaK family protein n=1 Tax=Micromonospora sp. NBC_01699 TaxID=2975984 RepID=UPI002E29DC44|nr:YoaK family protein [Micromonospora sp. NBC_01699]